MRKALAALATVALFAAVVVVSGALSGPDPVVAQESDSGETESPESSDDAQARATLDEILGDLVDEDVISQEQADAVADALRERGFRRFGHRHFGHHGGGGLSDVADVLGIETEELMTALRDGQTLAEIATDNGVDPQAVVDSLVAGKTERIDEAVANDRISAEEAEELKDQLRSRVEAFVDGEVTLEGRRGFGRGFGFRFGSPDADAESTSVGA